MKEMNPQEMTERERKIIKLLEWYRSNSFQASVDSRLSESARQTYSAFGHHMEEIIGKVRQIIAEKE